MLKKTYRVGFKTKIFSPKTLNTPAFNLKISKNNFSFSRYGFVISKKADKRAVVRNKLKRIFRKRVEEMLDKIKGGWDMIFYIKKEALNTEKEKISFSIHNALQKEGLLK